MFGGTRSRLLAILYASPETTFFARQLARLIASSAGTVQRELTTLTATGLILRTEHENQVLYRANRSHPAFADLRSLLAKTTGVFHLLGGVLKRLSKKIEFALVYGSFARGEETVESDIDLLLVGEVELDNLLERMAPLESELKRPINVTIYARKEVRAKIHSGNHFLKAVQRGPLVCLIGTENEFRELR